MLVTLAESTVDHVVAYS